MFLVRVGFEIEGEGSVMVMVVVMVMAMVMVMVMVMAMVMVMVMVMLIVIKPFRLLLLQPTLPAQPASRRNTSVGHSWDLAPRTLRQGVRCEV